MGTSKLYFLCVLNPQNKHTYLLKLFLLLNCSKELIFKLEQYFVHPFLLKLFFAMAAMAKNNLRRNGWTKYCSNLKMSSLEQFNNKNNFKRYVCLFCGFRTHKKYNLDVPM